MLSLNQHKSSQIPILNPCTTPAAKILLHPGYRKTGPVSKVCKQYDGNWRRIPPVTACHSGITEGDVLRQRHHTNKESTQHFFQKVLIDRWYCGWKKSCTTLDGWNPINNGINHLSTGAGFLPSTVSRETPKQNTKTCWSASHCEQEAWRPHQVWNLKMIRGTKM